MIDYFPLPKLLPEEANRFVRSDGVDKMTLYTLPATPSFPQPPPLHNLLKFRIPLGQALLLRYRDLFLLIGGT
jgi:hypothetical protein